MHVLGDNPFTNSVFLTFLRLPGGRSATIGYVERLRGFKGPLLVKGLEGGGPFGYLPNPRLPGFPVGTQVALVRRALLVTSRGEVAATPLTEGVQLRVYREVPPMTAGALQEGLSGDGAVLRRLGALQSSYEFVLSRPHLLAGRSGGLRAIAPDERDFRTGFATHGVDFFEEDRGIARSEDSRERVLESCAHCHGFPGVYSFNTFFPYRMGSLRNADVTRPAELSVMSVPAALAAAVRWKQDRPEWAVLQRLLREDNIP